MFSCLDSGQLLLVVGLVIFTQIDGAISGGNDSSTVSCIGTIDRFVCEENHARCRSCVLSVILVRNFFIERQKCFLQRLPEISRLELWHILEYLCKIVLSKDSYVFASVSIETAKKHAT